MKHGRFAPFVSFRPGCCRVPVCLIYEPARRRIANTMVVNAGKRTLSGSHSFARFPLLSPAVTSSPGAGEVFPLRGSFICADRQMTKSSPFRGSWHRAAMTERVQREAASPSPSLLRKSTSPKGRGLGIAEKFPVKPQSLWFRQRLSLWESWQSRKALTERASPLKLFAAAVCLDDPFP